MYTETHDTVTTIEVTDISNTSQSCIVFLCACVCVHVCVKNTEHEIYLLTDFEMHSTVLLTVSTILSSISLKLIHLA